MPVYVVTGANRGLGLEFVRQLSQSTDNTVLACVRSSSSDLADLKQAYKPNESNTHVLHCNTGDLSSIQSFAKEVQKTLGGDRKIEFLINNAAVNSKPEQTSLSIGPDDLTNEIRINVLGPAKTTEFLLAEGVLAKTARIVNLSSGLGSMAVSLGIMPRKCATYSISKGALNSLTVQQSGELREEGKLGPKCVVISIDPGWVKTRMGGEGAILEPKESIGGMLKAIHGLGEGDNGKFYTYTVSRSAVELKSSVFFSLLDLADADPDKAMSDDLPHPLTEPVKDGMPARPTPALDRDGHPTTALAHTAFLEPIERACRT
ncbi:hypothetical protein LTR91_013698 [Friedmanniomyces endolithicus]|uniref:NAD(P)-binding protein n=1 Tax=Friedmanniomyces endolithicus TaxID=329885 RepID=A0AAN6KD69_9PEZI|nr:hypothetical protein LTR94_009786 [Friedmanniomyces endolithicus]KAK0796266.1 hypothetical protein LTR38_008557 [Friedmanniomyces endolithicus]KAK0805586.1 hypothetical protein LTR75_007258 [Friedmanniomyces endolithicus]KAK0811375.1 hypothetical protein LTR59_001828 [Friedmanniomyces endolithicus]KAK0843194.1 hypothetical protein LTR03_008850 [Friedmanniomyces endolithicus]